MCVCFLAATAYALHPEGWIYRVIFALKMRWEFRCGLRLPIYYCPCGVQIALKNVDSRYEHVAVQEESWQDGRE